ncbi:unnamed protein product [Prorocentrum cordatum]|uniref:Uncharacterized protein n=1 Tax=Prorocentrum cordatum TaxID=2364126 RepID=A0ABN9U8P9_9DINO|nr:unnamed protein product [Polarella glacialis]
MAMEPKTDQQGLPSGAEAVQDGHDGGAHTWQRRSRSQMHRFRRRARMLRMGATVGVPPGLEKLGDEKYDGKNDMAAEQPLPGGHPESGPRQGKAEEEEENEYCADENDAKGHTACEEDMDAGLCDTVYDSLSLLTARASRQSAPRVVEEDELDAHLPVGWQKASNTWVKAGLMEWTQGLRFTSTEFMPDPSPSLDATREFPSEREETSTIPIKTAVSVPPSAFAGLGRGWATEP